MKLFTRKNFQRALFILACLVTIVFLLWQFENFRGRRAWEKHKAAALARGQVVEAKDLIPPPIPDASNFAAIPLFKPLFDYAPGTQKHKDEPAADKVLKYFDSMPQHYTSTNLSASNSWISGLVDVRLFVAGITNEQAASTDQTGAPLIPAKEAAMQTLTFLSRFDDALGQMEQAASRPGSRFPIAYDSIPTALMPLPHLRVLRNASHALCVRSAARLELGQTEAAAKDIFLSWRLADSIRTEPIMISHLVRLAMINLSFQPIADGISRGAWSDSQLEAFQRQLLSTDLFPELKKTIEGEIVLCGITSIDQLCRGSVKSSFLDDSDRRILGYWPDGWYCLEMLNYHRLMNAFEEVVTDKPLIDPHAVEQIAATNRKTLSSGPVRLILSHSILSAILVPAVERVVNRTSKMQTGLYIAGLACALERHRRTHGSFPEALDPLHNLLGRPVPPDVIQGLPLLYRRDGTNSYILYSVGWDTRDDGGKIAVKKPGEETDPPQDWVWRPVSRTN